MTARNIKVRYNMKSELLRNLIGNKRNFIKAQNTNENIPEPIYSPDFEQYPRWSYENEYDFFNNPYNQLPNMNVPQNQIPNQPPYNQPSYNNPMYNQPYNQFPLLYRNPYVPVGRERISRGYSQTTYEHDKSLLKLLYANINRELYPIIQDVLNEYEYDGSPIYAKEIDRETIAQLIDRVLNHAGDVSDNVQEVMLDEQSQIIEEYIFEWNRQNLLKSVIELILLNEIFEVRRPNYRRVRNRYNYNNGVYDGINYY